MVLVMCLFFKEEDVFPQEEKKVFQFQTASQISFGNMVVVDSCWVFGFIARYEISEQMMIRCISCISLR